MGNIQKFLMHLLISNISQVFLLLIGLAFRDNDQNSVFPLAPLEILWVNLITSSFLAIGLGLERAQHDIMLRPPHDPSIGVFTREIIIDKMVYGDTMGGQTLQALTVQYRSSPLPWQIFDLPGTMVQPVPLLGCGRWLRPLLPHRVHP